MQKGGVAGGDDDGVEGMVAVVFAVFEVEEIVAEKGVESPLLAEEGRVLTFGAEDVVLFLDEVGEVVPCYTGHVGGVGGVASGESFGDFVSEEALAFSVGQGFDAFGEGLEFLGGLDEPLAGKTVAFVGVFFSKANDLVHVRVVVGASRVDMVDIDISTGELSEANRVP